MTPHAPTHSAADDRREGMADRRLLDRDPGTDRRSVLGAGDGNATAMAEQVQMRPPTDAGAAAPASENSDLLFERS